MCAARCYQKAYDMYVNTKRLNAIIDTTAAITLIV
jgi:hypothetical protein